MAHPHGDHESRNHRQPHSPLAHAAAKHGERQPGGPTYEQQSKGFDLANGRPVPGTTPSAPAPPGSSGGQTPPGGPQQPESQYDISADPVLQQVQAAVTKANQMAEAAAVANREQLLEQYGDPNLAQAVLGKNDPAVAAARGNQESTLALLGRQNHQNTWQFNNTLDPSLVFSGAKVKGNQQLGQSYQDALAKAAAGVQSGLQSITGNLNAAEAANAGTLQSAIADAYNRAVNQALAAPPAQ